MTNLPSNWTIATGEDLFSSIRGVSYDKSDATKLAAEGLVPILRANNISDGQIITDDLIYVPARYVSAEQYLRDGDLLIAASSGSRSVVGKAARASRDHGRFAFGAFCTVARPRSSEFSSWLACYMNGRSYRAYVERVALGININNLRGSDLRAMPIGIAPLSEQRRIVAKIGGLFTKSKRARDQLHHVPRLVEDYKQAVLRAAFRGDLTKEWRNRNGNQGEWQDAILKDIAEIQSGITLGKKRNGASRLIKRPYLRVANVQRGWLDLQEIKEIEVTEQEAARLYLRPGDILMNEGGDRDKLGRGWVWEGQIENCIHQNHVFRVRLNDPAFPPKLISLYANEFGQLHFFDEGTQTTNLASISKTRLSNLPLRLPPVSEGIEILWRIETAFIWIDRLASEANNARKLINRLDGAILAKAFQGELVPQDPSDEPASVLLERIRVQRGTAPGMSRRRNGE